MNIVEKAKEKKQYTCICCAYRWNTENYETVEMYGNTYETAKCPRCSVVTYKLIKEGKSNE